MVERSVELNLPDHDRCLGCGACVAACPSGAIRMDVDGDGFQQVVRDLARCIGCSKCTTVCPANNVQPTVEPIWVGGICCKDQLLGQESSSGGAFTLLAEKVIGVGGSVWGAALDEQMRVRHVEVDRCDDLYKLRGSKYVQSDMTGVYLGIDAKLKANKHVLFSGTPCQVAAIRRFFGRTPRLLCVDVICFGVPSPLAWSVYCRDLERKMGSRIVNARFRDKVSGWGYNMRIVFENGKCLEQPFSANMYLKGFLGGLYNRRSCSSCPMRNQRSQSDITIGDFWGGDDIFPVFKNRLGVSLVLANTPKGFTLVKEVLDSGTCVYRETNYSTAIQKNPSLVETVRPHVHRSKFIRRLKQGTFDYGEINPSLLRRLVNFSARLFGWFSEEKTKRL